MLEKLMQVARKFEAESFEPDGFNLYLFVERMAADISAMDEFYSLDGNTLALLAWKELHHQDGNHPDTYKGKPILD